LDHNWWSFDTQNHQKEQTEEQTNYRFLWASSNTSSSVIVSCLEEASQNSSKKKKTQLYSSDQKILKSRRRSKLQSLQKSPEAPKNPSPTSFSVYSTLCVLQYFCSDYLV
jgi:hypothetical protein